MESTASSFPTSLTPRCVLLGSISASANDSLTCFRSAHLDARGPREAEEDPPSPWSPYLLGTPCSWTAHQDHRSPWKDRQSLLGALLPLAVADHALA